jgi:hypothetical protein
MASNNTVNDIFLGLQIATAIMQARQGSHDDQYDTILTTFDILSIRIPALRNDPVFTADLRKAIEDVIKRKKSKPVIPSVTTQAAGTVSSVKVG